MWLSRQLTWAWGGDSRRRTGSLGQLRGARDAPGSPGQLTGLWLFPFRAEHGGVVKKTVSAFRRPAGRVGCTVTLYLQEKDRS